MIYLKDPNRIRKWRERNRDRVLAKKREWLAKNADAVNAERRRKYADAKRRARNSSNPRGETQV